jgi:hypothetical protein
VKLVVSMGAKALRQISGNAVERLAQHLASQTEEAFGVRACLNDNIVGFPHKQQGAMRLDRSRKVYLLTFAVQ